MKKFLLLLSLFLFLFIINAKMVFAYPENVSSNYKSNNNGFVLDGELFPPGQRDETSCESIFGTSGSRNSFYTIVQHAVNIIKFGALILVTVLSIKDFVVAIAKKDDSGIKKATGNTAIRLVIGISVFFLPTVLILLLKLFGIGGSDPLCGIR